MLIASPSENFHLPMPREVFAAEYAARPLERVRRALRALARGLSLGVR